MKAEHLLSCCAHTPPTSYQCVLMAKDTAMATNTRQALATSSPEQYCINKAFEWKVTRLKQAIFFSPAWSRNQDFNLRTAPYPEGQGEISVDLQYLGKGHSWCVLESSPMGLPAINAALKIPLKKITSLPAQISHHTYVEGTSYVPAFPTTLRLNTIKAAFSSKTVWRFTE